MKSIKYFLFLNGIIVITAFSCQKDDEVNNWEPVTISNIVQDDCGCNTTISNELNDYITTFYGTIDSNFMKKDKINAISIDTVSKTCILISKNGIMVSYTRICNYPEEMIYWDLKNGKGVEVNITGTIYKSCKEVNNPTIYTFSDMILSKFSKNTKL